MQRNHRLTCARSALDDQQSVEGLADQVVLRRVDRLNDVPHLTRAIFVQVPKDGVIDAEVFVAGECGDTARKVSEDRLVEVEDTVLLGCETTLL